MLDIRFLQLDEYSIAAKFLDEHWQKNHIYCREQKLFDWTFHRSSHWTEPTYSFVVALLDGECIGVLGSIPIDFNRYGGVSNGLWLVNWMVSEEYRSTTTGIQLFNMFRRRDYKTIISFGISTNVVRFYKIIKWNLLDNIPRFVGLLDPSREQNTDLLLRTNAEWTRDRATKLVDNFTLKGFDKPPQLSALNGKDALQEWNKRGWNHWSPLVTGAVRDEAFLHWRYLDHPFFSYHITALPDGEQLGLAVWRTETINVLEDGARKPYCKFGRLVEFLPTGKENAKELLQKVIHSLSEEGATGFDWYNFHGPTGILFNELGLRYAGDTTDGADFPSRFNPLSSGGGKIGSAFTSPYPAPSVELDPSCPWYWTKSDSDQDRPN